MTSTPFRMFGGTVHSALVHALTAYDRRQSTKKYYNHNALGLYLIRLEDIEADIARGASVRSALIAGMHGPLLNCCLKAVGEPKPTDDETDRKGVVYRPAA